MGGKKTKGVKMKKILLLVSLLFAMPSSDCFTYSLQFTRSLILFNGGSAVWRVLFYAPIAVFVFTEIVEYQKAKKHYYVYLIILLIYSILDLLRFSLVIFSNAATLSSFSVLLFKGAIVVAIGELLKLSNEHFNKIFQVKNSSIN